MSVLEGDGQQQPQSWLCTLMEQESGNCVKKVKTPDWSNAPFVSKAVSKGQRSGETEIVVSASNSTSWEMGWSLVTLV